MSLDDKLLPEVHLQSMDHAQQTIQRLAEDSAKCKTWAVTVVAGLFAVSQVESRADTFMIALLPTMSMWLLDGYYLAQERRMRLCYAALASASKYSTLPKEISNLPPIRLSQVIRAAASFSVLPLYSVTLIAIILLSCPK